MQVSHNFNWDIYTYHTITQVHAQKDKSKPEDNPGDTMKKVYFMYIHKRVFTI